MDSGDIWLLLILLLAISATFFGCFWFGEKLGHYRERAALEQYLKQELTNAYIQGYDDGRQK